MTTYPHYTKLKSVRSSRSSKMMRSSLKSDKQKIVTSFSHYRNNLHWLAQNRDKIRKKYGDKYVAIHGNDVCIHEKNLPMLLERIKKKYREREDEVVIDFVGKKSINLLL